MKPLKLIMAAMLYASLMGLVLPQVLKMKMGLPPVRMADSCRDSLLCRKNSMDLAIFYTGSRAQFVEFYSACGMDFLEECL